MAAPASAYRTKSIYARSTDNTTDVQTQTAILQTDKPTMLSRFALDGLFNVSVDGTNDGVVGYCRIGSANAARHAAARQGNLRLYDGGDCVLYNDAGLNTLGFASLSVSKWPANTIKVTGTFQSAYYFPATGMGYEFKLDAGTYAPQSAPVNPPIAAASSSTDTRWMPVSGTQGQTCTVRAYIINTDGTFYSNEVVGTLTAPVYQYMCNFSTTSAAAALTGTSTAIYMTLPDYNNLVTALSTNAAITGIYGYTDPDMTIKIPAGNYAHLNDSANTSSVSRVFVASSTGEFTQYVGVTTTPSKDVKFSLGTSNGMIMLFATVQTGAKSTDTTFTVKIDALSSPWNGTGGQQAIIGGGSTSGTITANTTSMSKLTTIQDQRGVQGSTIQGYKITVTTISPNTLTTETQGL